MTITNPTILRALADHFNALAPYKLAVIEETGFCGEEDRPAIHIRFEELDGVKDQKRLDAVIAETKRVAQFDVTDKGILVW